MFGGNFAPRGWAFCDGQLLPISQNTALFSILGTTFGGNGQTTFALPDLRGRVPLHPGQGPGLSPYQLGQSAGSESVTLQTGQMPAHTHPATVTVHASGRATAEDPSGAVPATTSQPAYGAAPSEGTNMNAGMATAQVAHAGGNQPHDNLQPYLAVSFIIALEGIYPSRQ